MQVFRGIHHQALAPTCALTIGNFDGVHRGHQAMLALLASEAKHRQVAATVLTFEPHPLEFLAPQRAPARITKLRDKLTELELCGIDQVVVLRFDQQLASLTPQDFAQKIIRDGLHAQHVLVGDDFRFGAKRAGDYALLDSISHSHGFEVARMNSFEVAGQRVSSSLVREALSRGDMLQARQQLGRPYAISGHVVHGRKLGRELGYRTLNIRFGHPKPAASGIFVANVIGLEAKPLAGVASIGSRPTVDNSGEVLLETHVFDWWGDAYGRVVTIELLHKLRDEVKFPNLQALKDGIAKDCEQARNYWQQFHQELSQRIVTP
ncbi:bifunctional riboflavin kinase/FAD synthetase [Saezia sanguinis]|nr:bifunctional riboflavin kinase/FAD synthetase [Saezia sanguinis]